LPADLRTEIAGSCLIPVTSLTSWPVMAATVWRVRAGSLSARTALYAATDNAFALLGSSCREAERHAERRFRASGVMHD
jgi:hypothetical protein